MENIRNRFRDSLFAVKNLRVLVCAALLAAISIVCGKFLAFGVGNVLRFSFENLPILLAGIAFGPIVGAITGLLADLLGCLMVGYAINPLVTAGAVMIGFLSGFLSCLIPSKHLCLRVSLCVAVSHMVGSVLVKTYGLAAWYDFPLYQLMLWRALNYLIIGIVEGTLLYFLLRNGAVKKQLEHMKKR